MIDVCTMYFFKSGGDEYMYIRHDWPEPHMNVVYILFFGGDFLKYTGSYSVYIYGTGQPYVFIGPLCAQPGTCYTLAYGNSYTAVWKLIH